MKRGQIEDANICQKAIFKHALRVGRKKERQDTLWGLFGKMDKEHRTHRWSLRRNAENVLLSTYERWPAPQ